MANQLFIKLERQSALTAHVIRDSVWITIPARELVEGDVCKIKAGDIVPADGILLDGCWLPLVIDQTAIDNNKQEDEKKANAKADKLAHDAQKKVDGWQVRKFCVCALCWIERARSLATSTRMRLS